MSPRGLTVPVVALVALPVLVVVSLVAGAGAPEAWLEPRQTPVVDSNLAANGAGSLEPSVSPTSTATAAPSPTPSITPTSVAIPTTPAVVSPTATRATSVVVSIPTATPTRWSRPTATAPPAPAVTPRPTATPTPSPQTAFPKRRKLIAIDPGHGGQYLGAVHRDSQGVSDVLEKEVNLRVGLALAEMLKEAGYEVVLTRTSDTIVNTSGKDLNGDGKVNVYDDLQARVDLINASGADLLLSVHHNSSGTAPMRGTMTIYCSNRPFAERNGRLASLLQSSLLARLREAGYASVPDLGIRDDSTLGKPYGHLSLLGPTTPLLARPSKMPGALGEALFVSDDYEATLLKDGRVLRAIAMAYRDAVQRCFEGWK